MQVLDCEQGTEKWANFRKGVPTASGFPKIVQPQLASKTVKNATKKLDKLFKVTISEGEILAESDKPEQYDEPSVTVAEGGKWPKTATGVCLLIPGS